jgi:ankyrin repeat protein
VSSQAVPDPLAREQFFAAVRAGNLKSVKALVEKRAVDVSFTLDEGGSLAIHHAAAGGHMMVVKYLVSKRAPINARDPSGTTPLMWAVHRRHLEVAAYLITRKADLKAVRDDGLGVMDLARKTGKPQLVGLIKDPKSAPKIVKAWEEKQAAREKQEKLAQARKKGPAKGPSKAPARGVAGKKTKLAP